MPGNGQTIFEYLREPHPWVDLTYYTWWQVAMFFTGAVLWLICYAHTLMDIRRRKVVNIPIGAVCTNYGWEIATSLFFVPNMGKLLVIAYWGWMALDTFIFISALRYGYKQCRFEFFRKNIKVYLIAGILASFLLQATFITQYDLPMAPISANIINVYMSVAFLYLLVIPDAAGKSLVTAWSKFLGTFIINVMFCTRYPDNYFLIAITLVVAVFDVWYIVLLYGRKNRQVLPERQNVRLKTAV